LDAHLLKEKTDFSSHEWTTWYTSMQATRMQTFVNNMHKYLEAADMSFEVAVYAARRGDLPTLQQYAQTHPEYPCVHPMDEAVAFGHLHVVQWLCLNKTFPVCQLEEWIDYARLYNHPLIADWMFAFYLEQGIHLQTY
jgi:hypothetical protein